MPTQTKRDAVAFPMIPNYGITNKQFFKYMTEK